MKKEFEEFSEIYLKKYNVYACVCDKCWNNELGDYLYCLELDKSISNDTDERVLFSLSYDEIVKMM